MRTTDKNGSGKVQAPLSVRISLEVDKWLEQRAEARVRSKADVVREIIEDSRAREREAHLLSAFNEAAMDLTPGDRRERDLIAGSFVQAEEGKR
jgi:predicted DNA-binding protein